jgi:hypothetical protein
MYVEIAKTRLAKERQCDSISGCGGGADGCQQALKCRMG